MVMIFAGPIVIGAVVGAAFAYVFKDNTVRKWFSGASGMGVFKKKIEREELSGGAVEPAEIDEVPQSAAEKLKKATASIKEKTTEVFEGTAVKVKETIERVKEKAPEVYGATTVKVKETVGSVKEKTIGIIKDTSVKIKETDAYKDITVKAKKAVGWVKEKSGKVLEDAIEKIRRAFEPVNKRYK
jgi:ElaB/YqjD/DUF883 family membrane-anchored ribosome-binding protein